MPTGCAPPACSRRPVSRISAVVLLHGRARLRPSPERARPAARTERRPPENRPQTMTFLVPSTFDELDSARDKPPETGGNDQGDDAPRPRLADHPATGSCPAWRWGDGSVYLAEHRVMKRLVALKTIRPDLVGNATLGQRFEREILAAARLTHENIVRAYDAELVGGVPMLVMEYVEGIDLCNLTRVARADPRGRGVHVYPSGGAGVAIRQRTEDGAPGHQAAEPDAHDQRPGQDP